MVSGNPPSQLKKEKMHFLGWRIDGRRRLGRKPSIRKTGHGPFPFSPQPPLGGGHLLSGKKNRPHLVRFASSSTFRCWFQRKECEQTAAGWRQRRGHRMVGAYTLRPSRLYFRLLISAVSIHMVFGFPRVTLTRFWSW